MSSQWILFDMFVKKNAIDSLNTISKLNYSASASSLYTMTYYNNKFNTNCIFSTLMEASYVQEVKKIDVGKIYVRLQKPRRRFTHVQHRSTLSLKDRGTLTTHWATAYRDEMLNHELRVVKDMSNIIGANGCSGDNLSYRDNAIYIAQSMLYSIVWISKNAIRNVTNVEGFASMKKLGNLFYYIRLMLEKPELHREIKSDYIFDLTRDQVIYNTIPKAVAEAIEAKYSPFKSRKGRRRATKSK